MARMRPLRPEAWWSSSSPIQAPQLGCRVLLYRHDLTFCVSRLRCGALMLTLESDAARLVLKLWNRHHLHVDLGEVLDQHRVVFVPVHAIERDHLT